MGNTSANDMEIGINVANVTSFSGQLMFNDAMKYASDSFSVGKTDLTGPFSVSGIPLPPMDANGYPIGMGVVKAQGYAMRVSPFLHQGMHFPLGNYTLIFDGKGTVLLRQSGNPQSFTQNGGADTPHTYPVLADDFGILVFIVDSDPTDYVRNIRLIMPGYETSYQYNPFHTTFLQQLQPFSVLRFMDTMNTNAQPTKDWSARTTATYRTQNRTAGVAVEYLVLLANILQKDMWVNMPYGVNDSYSNGFSSYVRDNLTPGLAVYVEYGNEDWNSGGGPNGVFGTGWTFIQNYATLNNLTHGAATADLARNTWEIWRTNLAGSQVKLNRVAASQFGNSTNLDNIITRLVANAAPDDAHKGFEGISVAPYFTPNTAGFSSITTTAQFEAAYLSASYGLVGGINAFTAVGRKWSQILGRTIPTWCYEGGPSLNYDASKPIPSWVNAYNASQTDGGMYNVIVAFLDLMRQCGITSVVYYNFVAPITSFGPWGAMQYTLEPNTLTPKYNALFDFANDRLGLSVLGGFTVSGLHDGSTGTAQTITVTAIDTLGNVFKGYLGTVHFASDDVKAALPADYTFVPADAGTHAFSVTLKTVGTQCVTVADLAFAIKQNTNCVIVSPGPPGGFKVFGYPDTVAGTTNQFTVQATDAFGNNITNYTGTVHFTSNDWLGTFPANTAFAPEDNGVKVFSATLKAAILATLVATDTINPAITGKQTNIHVTPQVFSRLLPFAYPASVASGAAFTFKVHPADVYGNTLPNYVGTLHFTSNDPQAVVPADYTFVLADAGTHTFTATLSTVGSRRITIVDQSLPSSSVNITIPVT